jgi:hypothetical protein
MLDDMRCNVLAHFFQVLASEVFHRIHRTIRAQLGIETCVPDIAMTQPRLNTPDIHVQHLRARNHIRDVENLDGTGKGARTPI